MPEKRVKFALRISPQVQQLIKDAYPKDNCQSQNEFIEKAIRFYVSYLAAEDSSTYLPPALVSALRGTLDDYENHIARLLFKLSVETAMMMSVLAAGMEIDEEALRKIRARCVEEVKKTKGSLSLSDVVRPRRGS